MANKIKKLNFEFGKLSDPGIVKEHNEDEIDNFDTVNGNLFIVCDGKSGEQGGAAIAAKIAVKSIHEYFRNKKYTNLLKALNNAILYANHQIYNQAIKNEKFKGMGTTILVVLYKEEKIYYAYAGDSRLYILRNNKLQKLTKDHSVVQNLIDKGEITQEQAVTHPRKDELYNILGIKKDFKFSTCKNPISANEDDIFLLCTDGLTDVLKNQEIQDVLNEEDLSVQHKTLKLVEAVNKKGGQDNVSVQLVRFFYGLKESSKKQKPVKSSSSNKKIYYIIGAALLVILVSFGGYYSYNKFFNNEKLINLFNKKQKTEVTKEKIVETKPEKQETPVVVKEIEKPAPIKKQDTIFEYKISTGENFYRIGIRFNVTVHKLEQLNSIKAIHLRANQKILIPVKAIHTVQQGEVLSVIAEKYQTKVSQILQANKMENSDKLTVGMKLYIPKQYE